MVTHIYPRDGQSQSHKSSANAASASKSPFCVPPPLHSLPLNFGGWRSSEDTSKETLTYCDRTQTYGLRDLGLKNLGQVYYNLPVPTLVEHALLRGEGQLASNGALCVETGKYTGRSPADRFIVKEPATQDSIAWNQFNASISEEQFNQLYRRTLSYVQGHDLYIFDGYAGADPNYRFSIRVINELASQNLFAHQMLLRPNRDELAYHQPDVTVIAVPGLHGDPEEDGINSEAFIIIHLSKRLILIGGSHYAGEMKKAVFTTLNFFMPNRDVLPMHGAANRGDDGNTALFFGLSGTGKTTLSADPSRHLIGDDEHGWSPEGLFNFEGGCYAKTIRLSQENEPQIWSAIRFGALMENVIIDPTTRLPDYDRSDLTENTRVAYPIDHIPDCVPSGQGTHPRTVFLLTADAFGVLPPIARLTREQAMYHFLSGYTSKLAGTERGITTPQATFSACFGQCFFPMSPVVYAEMLGDRLTQHPETQVYLVNTGWSGGAYGIGQRMAIHHTRSMVEAALSGELSQVNYRPHPIFKVLVPDQVPGVPAKVLNPHHTWVNLKDYNQQAQELARRFVQNFQQFEKVSEAIANAAPDPAQYVEA
ncbi:MAG: phosphoenolpyruvate carboxykinase (ATP) [Elainellaceae cyanobacterium]